MNIEVVTKYDGSSPYDDAGVQYESKYRAVLLPSLRRMSGNSEEEPGAGSRFNTRLHNSGNVQVPFTVVADWETAARVCNHDLGYIRRVGDVPGTDGGGAWRMIPGYRRGKARIEYQLELSPGITELGLYPEFNYTACEKYVHECSLRGVDVLKIGKSREKRDIWMLSFPSSNNAAVPFFIQARDHAYETAGSYCVLGIVEFLLGASPRAQYLRSKFNVFIVPMTNPDGVYNGMSRLTWEQGADMNRVHTVSDAAHDTLKSTIDRLRPVVHMNVHNWTSKFDDGLLANDRSIADNILIHMPPDHVHNKRWIVQTRAEKEAAWKKLAPEEVSEMRQASCSWKNYCQEYYDAIGVCFEFPWFGLDTAAMQVKGTQAFIALALAAIKARNY